MIKKAVLGGLGALAVGVAVFGLDVLSYVSTACGWATNSVKGAIPVDFEIERARKLIADIVPDIRQNMHTIAQEEVQVEQLTDQISVLETRLEKEKQEILRLKDDLAGGDTTYRYAGRSYTEDQVKLDLARRFERFKTSEATLASLQEMQLVREKSLAAARQKLEGMLSEKRNLEVDVEHLEARLQMVEAAQTTSAYTFDDSQLSRAKSLVADLRTRLTVAERLLNAEGELSEEIPLDEPDAEHIVDEVATYFDQDYTGSQVARMAQ